MASNCAKFALTGEIWGGERLEDAGLPRGLYLRVRGWLPPALLCSHPPWPGIPPGHMPGSGGRRGGGGSLTVDMHAGQEGDDSRA